MASPKIAHTRVALATAGAALMVALVPATSRAANPLKTDTTPSSQELMAMRPDAPREVTKLTDSDSSGYVSRDEFMKRYQELINRLERNTNPGVQVGPPQFTDAG